MPVRILVASGPFKGSLNAMEASRAIAAGIRRGCPNAAVDVCPVADGGAGTVDAFKRAKPGNAVLSPATGPLGQDIHAEWYLDASDATAVLEVASVAGLSLVPHDRRDPTQTTSFGLGQLIASAMDSGAKTIIVGLGDSATNDGGIGIAQALGAGFQDIEQPATGAALSRITAVNLESMDRRLERTTTLAACDVSNPLLGPEGAAYTFAPQKGATPPQVEKLDNGLRHLAAVLDHADPSLPGTGAAGGLGYGLMAFCGARLERGIEIILDALRFEDRVATADLVVTGEGCLDGQSLMGKTCTGVGRAAGAAGKPVIVLAGQVGRDVPEPCDIGVEAYYSILEELDSDLNGAMNNASMLLEELAAKVVPQHM